MIDLHLKQITCISFFLCCPTFAIFDAAACDSRYLIDMDAQQHVELVRGASHEVVAAAEVNNPGR